MNIPASKEEQLSTLPTINGSSGMEASVSRYIGLVSAVAEVLPQQAVSPPMNTGPLHVQVLRVQLRTAKKEIRK